uniref:Sulfotransferase domain-containing protein n=1 Tax=Acrobeloides nanus TaxID=290746 RepID=A0A914CR86_9BILA
MLNLYKNLPNGVVQFPGHPRAYLVDGFLLPLVPEPAEEKLKTPQHLKYHETDILVCTYPKSGTYWTNFICAQLLGKADFISDSGEEGHTLSRIVPQMDVWPVEYYENLPQPRIIYSHLPMCYMAVNEKPKYIVVMRNPKDVLVR